VHEVRDAREDVREVRRLVNVGMTTLINTEPCVAADMSLGRV